MGRKSIKDQILLVLPITFRAFFRAKDEKKAEVSRDVKKVRNISLLLAPCLWPPSGSLRLSFAPSKTIRERFEYPTEMLPEVIDIFPNESISLSGVYQYFDEKTIRMVCDANKTREECLTLISCLSIRNLTPSCYTFHAPLNRINSQQNVKKILKLIQSHLLWNILARNSFEILSLLEIYCDALLSAEFASKAVATTLLHMERNVDPLPQR